MAQTSFWTFTLYIYPYPISAPFTMHLIPRFAFCIILPRHTSELFTFLPPFTMFIRPALFTFACLLAAVWRAFPTVLATQMAAKNAEVSIMAKPVLWTIRIASTIISNPNALKVIAIVTLFAVVIEYTFFALTRFLAAIWRCLCAISAISAALFTTVYCTIFILWA